MLAYLRGFLTMQAHSYFRAAALLQPRSLTRLRAQAQRRSWGEGQGERGAGAGESAPSNPGGYGRRGPDGPCRRRSYLSGMGLLFAGPPLRRIEGTRSDGAYREVGAPGGSCRA